MGNFISSEDGVPLRNRKVKRYGCIPDISDQRDIYTNINTEILSSVDLRKTGNLSEVKNQGLLGSSSIHSLLSAYEYDLNTNHEKQTLNLSSNFLYYNQRIISGTVYFDSGGSLRDSIKVLNNLGCCEAELCPNNYLLFEIKPSEEAYKNAKELKKSFQYRKIIGQPDNIMKMLSINIPVLMGMTVYESFESENVARTGFVTIPSINENILGCISVLIVGYNLQKEMFIVRNNWGSEWGQEGYFWLPYSYLQKNCRDFWVLSTKSKNRPESVKEPVHSPVRVSSHVNSQSPINTRKLDTPNFREELNDHDISDEDDNETIL